MPEIYRRFQKSLDIAARHTYEIGKRRYIAIYGTCVVGAGIFMSSQFIAFYVLSVGLRGKWLALWLVVSLLMSAGLGTLFGWFQWWRVEKRTLRRL